MKKAKVAKVRICLCFNIKEKETQSKIKVD